MRSIAVFLLSRIRLAFFAACSGIDVYPDNKDKTNLDKESKNISVGLGLLDQLRSQVVSSDPADFESTT